jgi:hypothetical protein
MSIEFNTPTRIQYRSRESRYGRNVYTLSVQPDVTDRELVEYIESTRRDHNSFGTYVERSASGTATVSFYTD